MSDLAYKLVDRAEWEAAVAVGSYSGSGVDRTDGYIHMSTRGQLPETARKHYAARHDLVLVTVDLTGLGEALRWEPSRGGALFPHLYRALDLSDVLWDKSLPLGATGHIFPEGIF